MNKIRNILLFSIISISSVLAQSPKKFDFSSPLDIPLILSGTFGELRTNHFHTGIDIKTKGRIGFDVKSINDGYVSRVNVSPFGYGKAIYITHPNGYTSVYAHLDSFSPEIEKLIKKQQYKKERFTITIHPKKDEIKVLKNQVVGKTGNSGGSGGPHLHFEIRDTKTAKPQNPFNFGYKIKDSKKPIIRNVYVYRFDRKDGGILSLDNIAISSKKVDTVFVPSGWIGIGIDTYDKLDYANNKNGVYSVKLSIDKNTYFEYKMDSLDFTEQRYINSFIDYAYFKENRRRVQKLFLDPGNKLSIYNVNQNNGYLQVEEGKLLNVEMLVEDFKGNKTIANVVIKGSSPIATAHNRSKVELDYSKDNIFETHNFKIKIPKGALYNNANFDYSYNDSIFHIGDPNIPLQKSCSIELKIDNVNDSHVDKMIIVSVSDKGKESFAGGKIKAGYISTRTRNFGKYKISYDTLAPTITPINLKEGKWMSKEKFLKIKIKDDLSGIKKYRGEIDGLWIRMAFDAKRGILKYNFNDLKLKGQKHIFTLKLEDSVGNSTEYKVLFYRKN